MQYQRFIELIITEPTDVSAGAGALTRYLYDLASEVLASLSLPQSDQALRRFAAVSSLVRSCEPGSLVVVDGTLGVLELAAAHIDVVPRRVVAVARADEVGRWVSVTPSRSDVAQVRKSAADTGKPLLGMLAGQGRSPDDAVALITSGPPRADAVKVFPLLRVQLGLHDERILVQPHGSCCH